MLKKRARARRQGRKKVVERVETPQGNVVGVISGSPGDLSYVGGESRLAVNDTWLQASG